MGSLSMSSEESRRVAAILPIRRALYAAFVTPFVLVFAACIVLIVLHLVKTQRALKQLKMLPRNPLRAVGTVFRHSMGFILSVYAVVALASVCLAIDYYIAAPQQYERKDYPLIIAIQAFGQIPTCAWIVLITIVSYKWVQVLGLMKTAGKLKYYRIFFICFDLVLVISTVGFRILAYGVRYKSIPVQPPSPQHEESSKPFHPQLSGILIRIQTVFIGLFAFIISIMFLVLSSRFLHTVRTTLRAFEGTMTSNNQSKVVKKVP